MWPFKDESTGAKVYKDKFYGFGDSGFLAGSFAGYDSREEAVRKIQAEYPDCELGLKPEDLGSYGVTVLSGDEYVNRLRVVSDPGGCLMDYGSWSTAPTKAYIRDSNWKGAYIILADSYQEAHEAMKRRVAAYKDLSLDDFKKAFEEIDIANGMVLETVGDF